jgi:uncharacterized protein YmfQ (DUF2313 family)
MIDFIKEYVSLIRLLLTIFTAAVMVGRILINSQLCTIVQQPQSAHQGPNNFWPEWIPKPEIISCMMHTATMSQRQKAVAQRMGTLGTHSTLRIHLAADSGHWNQNERVPRSYNSLDSRDKIPGPKTAWEVCTIS